MSVTYREVRRYTRQRLDSARVTETAETCGFRVTAASPIHVELRVSASRYSWGERIEINLADVDGDGLLDISSRSRGIVVEDWGKNQKNVQRLFAEIEKQLSSPVAGEQVPFCVSCGYVQVTNPTGACPECGSSRQQSSAPGWGFRDKLRKAFIVAAGLSAIEVALLWGFNVFVPLPGILPRVIGVFGSCLIVSINFGVILFLLLLSRWWRPLG